MQFGVLSQLGGAEWTRPNRKLETRNTIIYELFTLYSHLFAIVTIFICLVWSKQKYRFFIIYYLVDSMMTLHWLHQTTWKKGNVPGNVENIHQTKRTGWWLQNAVLMDFRRWQHQSLFSGPIPTNIFAAFLDDTANLHSVQNYIWPFNITKPFSTMFSLLLSLRMSNCLSFSPMLLLFFLVVFA